MRSEVLAIIRDYRTCEFTAVCKGSPQTWPVSSLLLGDGRFLITTGIGLPRKALNVRRNPKVSLLFSDPTGSGINQPGAVLIQGDATSEDRILADISSDPDLTALAATVTARQHASFFMTGPIGRRLFPYYWMRILIHVTPRRVYSWPHAISPSLPHMLTWGSCTVWSEAAKRLAGYDEAVVTALDAAGYPVSIRQMAPRYDPATGEFTVEWPPGLAVTEGPATVLCHSHDEKLWNIKQLQINGRQERRGGRWVFVSTEFRPSPVSQLGIFLRLARDMRKSGKRYVDRRGLEKPTVNWQALKALRDRDSPKMR